MILRWTVPSSASDWLIQEWFCLLQTPLLPPGLTDEGRIVSQRSGTPSALLDEINRLRVSSSNWFCGHSAKCSIQNIRRKLNENEVANESTHKYFTINRTVNRYCISIIHIQSIDLPNNHNISKISYWKMLVSFWEHFFTHGVAQDTVFSVKTELNRKLHLKQDKKKEQLSFSDEQGFASPGAYSSIWQYCHLLVNGGTTSCMTFTGSPLHVVYCWFLWELT